MPRQARIYYPGGVFHVISRCLNREYLFAGPADRRYYLDLLATVLGRHDAKVLAWCIMSNHVHLVVRAGEEPLGRLMKAVHSGYAMWKNHREGRLGPLFAGRYKTVLVEEDAYLLELIRYVHLNPVRAGVAPHPDETDWTSHRAYASLQAAPVWLETTTVLSQFHEDRAKAMRLYRSFVAEGLESERSPVLSGDEALPLVRDLARSLGELHRPSGAIVGSEAFVEEVLQMTDSANRRVIVGEPGEPRRSPPTIEALIDTVCEVLQVERHAFDESRRGRRAALARRLLARVWVREYGGSQATLARHLNVASSIMSRWYARAVSEAISHGDLYDRVVAALPRVEGRLRFDTGESVRYVRRETRSTVNLELVGEESIEVPEGPER